MTNHVLAIDGPAGSGKSSVSRLVASNLGWTILDTGAMYRAITWVVINAGIDPLNETQVGDIAHSSTISIDVEPGAPSVFANGVDVTVEIRSAEVTLAVSAVSAVAQVRARLVQLQRETVSESKRGIVIEGRDIGTVVLPDAQLKIFLTADPRTRAIRRNMELGLDTGQLDLENMQKAIEERDFKDSTRELSPLHPAPDAIVMDTSTLTKDQVVADICLLAREKYALS